MLKADSHAFEALLASTKGTTGMPTLPEILTNDAKKGLVGDDCCTLIDAGLSGSADDIMGIARKLQLPIRRILLTHAHVDHIGSLDALAAQLPGVAVDDSSSWRRSLVLAVFVKSMRVP